MCRKVGLSMQMGWLSGNVHLLQYSFLENSMDRGYRPWGHKEFDMTE